MLGAGSAVRCKALQAVRCLALRWEAGLRIMMTWAVNFSKFRGSGVFLLADR